MAKHVADDEDWEDDDSPDDDSEEWEPEPEDEDETVPCPHCQELIYDGAERCPHCEQYLSPEDEPRSRKPWWVILGFILCFIVAYFWVMP